uniref:Retrotransposon Copia-like N-terminal domain-containing protein n=1 Tax=Chenopodium quinoa TaxID=63459 RepID=A0A803KNI1_CHEQI
ISGISSGFRNGIFSGFRGGISLGRGCCLVSQRRVCGRGFRGGGGGFRRGRFRGVVCLEVDGGLGFCGWYDGDFVGMVGFREGGGGFVGVVKPALKATVVLVKAVWVVLAGLGGGNPASPYFIHPSKNTSQSLISEKFYGEGYGEWRRSMIIALSAKNKLGFVDGSLPKPAVTDSVYAAWMRCDAIIISYILRSLDNSIARSVLYLTTAREIWRDLEECYSQTSGPQLDTLQ